MESSQIISLTVVYPILSDLINRWSSTDKLVWTVGLFKTIFPGGYFSKYQTIGVKLGCRCSKRLLLKFEGTSLYEMKNFRESVFHSRNDVAFRICLKLKRIDLLLVSRPWQTVNNGYFLRIFAWIKHISWYKLYKHNTADNVNILSTQN